MSKADHTMPVPVPAPAIQQPSKRGLTSKPEAKSVRSGSRNRSGRKNKREKQINSNRSNQRELIDDSDLMLEKSIVKNSKKGVDISHLLDFSVADEGRELESATSHRSHRRSSNHGKGSLRSAFARLDLTGRNYININYKFIVDYHGDYRSQMIDPSMPLEDKDIVRVIVNDKECQCPICLSDEFIAPRMTRCGHIFCLPCLLRLLQSTSDDNVDAAPGSVAASNAHAYCPLCSEIIKKRHTLLPVLMNEQQESKPTPGDTIDLTLMYRPADKVLAQPFQYHLQENQFDGTIPWIEPDSTTSDFFDKSDYLGHSRLMKCDSKFILSCLEQELSSIESHRLFDKEMYHDSVEHYDLAKQQIEHDIDDVKQRFDSSTVAPEYKHSAPLSETDFDNLLVKQHTYEPKEKGFFFYQCITGTNTKMKYFLSTLDIQLLKAIYGDYSKFPFKMQMKLENINYEDAVVSPELIHRIKYLCHLPVGTEVGFMELDWLSGATNRMIPPEVYAQFKKRLKDRARRTRNKRIKEDRNKKTFEKQLEFKTLQFYSSENNLPLEEYGYKLKRENEFNHFPSSPRSSNDVDFERPTLESLYTEAVKTSEAAAASAAATNSVYGRSVWGTQVPLSEQAIDETLEVERIIRDAKTSNKGKGKRKGKRIVLSFD